MKYHKTLSIQTSSQTSFDNAFSIAKALDKDKSDAEKIKTVADSLQEAIKTLD